MHSRKKDDEEDEDTDALENLDFPDNGK